MMSFHKLCYKGGSCYQDKQSRNDIGVRAYYWVGIKIVDWTAPTEEDRKTLI